MRIVLLPDLGVKSPHYIICNIKGPHYIICAKY